MPTFFITEDGGLNILFHGYPCHLLLLEQVLDVDILVRFLSLDHTRKRTVPTPPPMFRHSGIRRPPISEGNIAAEALHHVISTQVVKPCGCHFFFGKEWTPPCLNAVESYSPFVLFCDFFLSGILLYVWVLMSSNSR